MNKLIFLLAFMILTGCGEAPEKTVQDGNQLYGNFDFAGAEEKYRTALAQVPNSPELHFNISLALFRQFNFNGAIEHYSTADAIATGPLAAQIKYNLGNVYYRMALDAMASNQDVKTPLRQAIQLYRDSLAQDSSHQDSVYNLALAKTFLWEIENQNVVPQPNARFRDQKQSENKGQMRTEGGDKSNDKDQTKNPEAQEGTSEQSGRQAETQEQSQQGAESRRASEPRSMSVEAAERLLSMIREHNRAVKTQRQQWRRNQMRNTDVEKYW